MKKKGILAFLLCFMMLFFVGCGNGGPSGGGGSDDPDTGIENPDDDFGDTEEEDNPLEMEGAKVLAKPSNYSFKDAVGDFSANYYNIFSNYVMSLLYKIYENNTAGQVDKDYLFNPNLEENSNLIALDKTKGLTYAPTHEGTEKDNLFYLYDSLRYTISSIENMFDGEDLDSQTLILDYSTKWNWTISQTASGTMGTFFNSNPDVYTIDGNKVIADNYYTFLYQLSSLTKPSFGEFFSGVRSVGLENGETDYWYSPYYQKVFGDLKNDANVIVAQNFFQDALEYATYLFVLGYDYVDANGVELSTAQATEGRLFDFNIVADVNGAITDVKVKGWNVNNNDIDLNNANEISIVDALGKVKAQYQELGGYVGVTKSNREQIVRFIKDKVIGKDAYAKSEFTINESTSKVTEAATVAGDVAGTVETKDADGNDLKIITEISNGVTKKTEITTKQLKFNRNYDAIINNIVEYACTKAPIGKLGDQSLKLSDAYLASTITDYMGNYFECAYSNNEDDNLFEFIPAAEYQSIVIYPHKDDIGKAIGDLWLAFEYWDDPNDTISPTTTKERDKENGIVINIGLRYFNSKTGEIKDFHAQKEIGYGKFPMYYNADGSKNENFEEEYESHIISFSDTGTGTDLEIGTVTMNMMFTRDIGGGAIDPFTNSTALTEVGQITIKGNTKAKDYYMLNDSSSYGVFGTLNPEMFKGDDGCDYIEVYFDIVKVKGKTGVNYDFKVGIMNFLAAESGF